MKTLRQVAAEVTARRLTRVRGAMGAEAREKMISKYEEQLGVILIHQLVKKVGDLKILDDLGEWLSAGKDPQTFFAGEIPNY